MINVYHNFFDEIDFLSIQKISQKIFEEEKTMLITNSRWNEGIVLDSGNIFIDQSEKTDQLLRPIISKKIQRKITRCMFYYWMPTSHIPWHNDSIYSGGLTIYLNDSWSVNQGGIFMFSRFNNKNDHSKFLNDNITGIFPQRNMAVEQLGNIYHSVCPLSKNSDVRRTIQCFYE